jgi:hypothetical protein
MFYFDNFEQILLSNCLIITVPKCLSREDTGHFCCKKIQPDGLRFGPKFVQPFTFLIGSLRAPWPIFRPLASGNTRVGLRGFNHCVMELMSLGCEVHMYLREYYNTVHTTKKKEIFIFVHKWFKLVQHSNVIVYFMSLLRT